MTEGTSTSGATAATETAVPVAAVAAPAAAAQASAPVDASVAMAAMAATTAAPSAPAAQPAAPAVGPTAAAIAAAEALAAVEAAAAAKKADKAEKADSDSGDSMSDAEVLPEVELASIGDGGAAAGGQAGLPCGVLPVVDAPVVEAAPPVEVPVGDAGFAFSPVLLGLLGLGALGLGYLLLKDDDDDDEEEDANDAPVAADEAVAVNEDATATGTLDATDADGDTLTYAVSGTAPTGLTINANGSYTFDASSYDALDAGQTQVVTATYVVTDPDGASDTGAISVTITGVNDIPDAVNDVAAATEGAAAVTGSVATNDTDADGDPLTFSLNAPVAGLTLNPNGTYSFDPTNAAYDGLAAGATQTVVATYTANDGHGGTDTATLTITVTGVNDAPEITSAATEAVDENVAAGSEVYDANAVDADGDTLTYTIGGADAAFFTIDPATGEVSIIASPDFETQPVYNITVTASDGTMSDTQAVVITVNDLPDAPPVLTVANAVTVDENVATSSVVVDANAVDPDGGTVTYSLAGADAAAFTIDADDGEVRFVSSPDFETDPSYSFTIVATDDEGMTDSEAVTVTVNDVPEMVVRLLDVDNDANTLTPFEIDAGTGWYQFTDDDDIANNVELVNFGPEDVIVFDAPATGLGSPAFTAQDTGDGDGLNDLLITINNGGTLSEIRIEDVAAPTVFVFDEASAEAAIAGTNNFQFA